MSAYCCSKLQPPEHLKPYVDYFYSLKSANTAEEGSEEPWFPIGSMDLIFDVGAPFQQGSTSDTLVERPQAFVAGLYEHSIKIKPTGPIHQVGIVFKPGKFRYFIKGDQQDHKGAITPLSEIYGAESDRMLDLLTKSKNEGERLRLLQVFAEETLRSDKKENYFIDCCVSKIKDSQGKISLSELAAKGKTSDRHFRRIFKDYIGLNPKLFSKMVRLQCLVKMSTESTVDLNRLYDELGYYDSSHLLRDFRNIAGMRANEFFRKTELISKIVLNS